MVAWGAITMMEFVRSSAMKRGVPAWPATVSVAVRNGSGVEGQADAVRLALEAVGFTVDSTANAEGIPPTATTISFPPDLETQARLLARHLTSGAELVADSALGGVVLTTGIDFTTVMEHPAPETDDAVVSAADPSEAEDSVTTTTEHDPNQVRDLVGKTPGDEPPGIDCG